MPIIDINLIESAMDKLSNQLDKSSIKNENDFGFKTPSRNPKKESPSPPSIKKEYHEARLKRRRSVLLNLNELGNLSDDESNSPKIIRLNFSPLINDS